MLRLRFFGVGDGDCIVVELPDGRYGLIDSCIARNASASPATSFLQGRKLAFACLSHPHADHYGGMRQALEGADVSEADFWHGLSDLEYLIEFLDTVFDPPTDSDFARSDRDREARELVDLLNWVYTRGKNRIRPLSLGNTVSTWQLGKDLDVIRFGPTPEDFKNYQEHLTTCARERRPPERDYANQISVTLLIRYGEHMIWLLADLLKTGLKRLPQREFELHTTIQRGVRASVLKVPHHGAKNACFEGMSALLTRCDPSDVIVISAAGGVHHPNPSVSKHWADSGKRVVGTWENVAMPSPSPSSDWTTTIIDSVAPNSKSPCNVLLSVPTSGPVAIAYF